MAFALGVSSTDASTEKIGPFPRDVDLVGAGIAVPVALAGGSILITREMVVYSDYISVKSSRDNNIIAVISGGSAQFPAVSIPAGEVIYVAFSAQNSAVLYFREVF